MVTNRNSLNLNTGLLLFWFAVVLFFPAINHERPTTQPILWRYSDFRANVLSMTTWCQSPTRLTQPILRSFFYFLLKVLSSSSFVTVVGRRLSVLFFYVNLLAPNTPAVLHVAFFPFPCRFTTYSQSDSIAQITSNHFFLFFFILC